MYIHAYRFLATPWRVLELPSVNMSDSDVFLVQVANILCISGKHILCFVTENTVYIYILCAYIYLKVTIVYGYNFRILHT